LHTMYYLDLENDTNADYHLGFGPYWYEPETGATRPTAGDTITITGGLIEEMSPSMVVVFEINGLDWRDSTGAPPWSGGWVHQDADDSTWIHCPTDSLDHLGFPPQSMMGMMWPDSLYCQFEEMDPDSMPGDMDSTVFEGYTCNFNTAMGGEMGMGQGSMGFDQLVQFQFHYDEDHLNMLGLDEESIRLFSVDESGIMEEILGINLDITANIFQITDSDVADYYVLKADEITVNVENGGSILPESLSVEAIYPNPFNPQTHIQFGIKEAGSISIRVYDLQGKLIDDLFNGYLDQGKHNVVWNAENTNGKSISSGTYLIKISDGNSTVSRHLTLLK